MDFFLVITNDPRLLADRLSELYNDGWEPFGGVCVVAIGGNHPTVTYYQLVGRRVKGEET